MNQREKIILVITIVLIFIAIGMKMLPEDFLRGSGGEVAGARGTFEEYLNQVKIGPAIREAYQRVNTQMPERLPNSTPEATFSNEVARRLQEKGWERPTVKPA
ncbi:hypothetical protein HY256_01965, partial [Candidatus Sumerlaeota bacterium]|nr:hypothetical protein [Candidatus Sumerlaeota bacterium]